MCGRFALKAPPAELVARFGLDECAAFKPRYNIPPGTDIPVIRQPYTAGDRLPFWAGHGHADQHHLYDLDVDPDEGENRTGEAVEAELVDLLRTALIDLEAPDDQSERLGLS